MELTQNLVRDLFDYKEGCLFWKKPSKYKPFLLGRRAGYINEINRSVIMINQNAFLSSRIIFLWHKGWLPEIVDHENNNPLDDRIENLRAANYSQNNRNCTSAKNSTSKYLGVGRYKGNPAWIARIVSNGKRTNIGSFSSEDEAALAYNKYAVIIHGEFANLNIIDPK